MLVLDKGCQHLLVQKKSSRQHHKFIDLVSMIGASYSGHYITCDLLLTFASIKEASDYKLYHTPFTRRRFLI